MAARVQRATKHMIDAFCEGALSSGNRVDVVDVCRKNISGCVACEYYHTKGNGVCIQKDDMQEIYELLKNAEMLVIASPIYYHGISGQLKCAIDRFYSAAYPKKPPHLKKVAMILSSGDSDMYDGALFSFNCDRIRDCQTRTCQQIGAQKRYDEKLQSNEAVGLFRKYYKRYYARTKVNQIKPDEFKAWNYKACEMRDKCQNGEITAAEFEEWLYNSFKNRRKKKIGLVCSVYDAE